MDIHNTCLVVAVLSLSVSTVVIWLSLVRQHEDDNSGRHETDMKAILRSLHISQSHASNATEQVNLQFISSDFLWKRLELNLGNYFTRGYFIHREKYHKKYTHSSLTILPFFQDQDRLFERCLLGTAMTLNHAVSPKMTLWNRLKWDSSSEGVFRFKHKFKVHYGEAAFGVCSNVDFMEGSSGHAIDGDDSSYKYNNQHDVVDADRTRCSHVVIMQDPITMAIADLVDCLLDPIGRPHCQLVHQNITAIEDWVTARGNIVFKNILTSSDICRNMASHQQPQPEVVSHANFLSPRELCEGIDSLRMNHLQPKIIEHLVNLISKNMNNLFSFVAIFEDFSNSMIMLNHVFRFPLHQCEFVSRFSKTTSENKPNQNKRTKSSSIQEISLKNIQSGMFENSQYKNIPSVSRYYINTPDSATLLEALSRIENSVTWSEEVPTVTTSSPLVQDNQSSYSVFHDDLTDTFNDSDIIHQRYSDLEGEIANIDSDISNISINYPDNAKIFNNSMLHLDNLSYKTESTQFEAREDDIDDESDDYLDNDNIHSLKTENFNTNAVLTKLYRIFVNNQSIRRSLDADLRIYDAVKKLYFAQKRLFFNSIKPL